MKLPKNLTLDILTGIVHAWVCVLGSILLIAIAAGLLIGVIYGVITHPYITLITLITLVGAINGLSL